MAKPKIGVVGIPGKWSTEALADAAEAATGFRLVIDMAEVCAELDSGRLVYREHDLTRLDGIVVKKISEEYSPHVLDRLEMLRQLQRAGVRVFSKVERIIRLIDRLSCTLSLYNADIPMPPTRITESAAIAADTVTAFGSAVFKPLYSTKARGMTLIDADQDPQQLRQQIEAFRVDNPVMYIQKKLALPGRDLGMVFLDGEYLGSYARVGKSGTWNTTIRSGGHYEGYQADEALVTLARKAQAIFGLDFTTVDVAETEQGPVVFEVSAFGGFRGAKEGMGIDVPSRYVAYILEELDV
ncbi:MAG: GAK system ATP-grasp enzyme [Candidatus Thiodiazotropha endolucinida]|uniref:GAK system ATP-grasp enzyme n=1 Tax=Candidatus Thiodiazotropha taylori TaxID=2792791 RepID=A0A9E4NMH2_9GAMM|nr:GAK system ATP-grasp enzyme [Candidatus Thiodiazotropha sp. (ex Lucina pensylvanica)]MBT3039320.1 GAK system ATP-grasp enzyme [Candidatus Thiodiazotropha sp. (ex Codakia orbicularis)]MBT3056745.1 GAK system ATP-grasp enzyme [Candidatus Thiodiazotropha sp. (ex Codakia orbicularis)]MCG7979928.1 GAK system ATP-grasp enzyme [Candidatus Thiodiazotropha taylori]MCW4238060.1 GAK system ATP-grasp enzyme [Candidatus Thiodiazotropha endolucinida]